MDGGGVHFHSLTVMVTGPEKWAKKGERGSMLLSSSFTLSLPDTQLRTYEHEHGTVTRCPRLGPEPWLFITFGLK